MASPEKDGADRSRMEQTDGDNLLMESDDEHAARSESLPPPDSGASDIKQADGLSKSEVWANVERLKKEQFDLRVKRQRLTSDLRNASRQKSRLKMRAKMLSDKDLLEVIHLRRDEQIKRDAAVNPETGQLAKVPSPDTPKGLEGTPSATSSDTGKS